MSLLSYTMKRRRRSIKGTIMEALFDGQSTRKWKEARAWVKHGKGNIPRESRQGFYNVYEAFLGFGGPLNMRLIKVRQ